MMVVRDQNSTRLRKVHSQPMSFARFPRLYNHCNSAFVSEAYTRIREAFERGRRLEASEEPDGLRLKVVADEIRARCFSLLDNLRLTQGVPGEWVDRLRGCISELEIRLRNASNELLGVNSGRDR